MTNKKLATICIPHYNNEATIVETLDSLLHQTYQPIIIKIFDNCSTDNSMAILNDYAKQYDNIEVIQNETNIGGEANFTKCLQNGEGAYTAVFHADDVYCPTIVEEQVHFLESHPQCGGVAVHAYTIDETSAVTGERFLPVEFSHLKEYVFSNSLELFRTTLTYGNIITCPSVMARTSVYREKIQQWNGSQFKTSADLDVWLRLADCGGLGLLTKPLMKYRLSTQSYSYNNMRARIGENDMFLVLEAYKQAFASKGLLRRNDEEKYQFLIFKDYVNRTINQIILQKAAHLPLSVFNAGIIKMALATKMNFKIYSAGCIVLLLRKIPLPKWILKMMYTIRFGQK